MTKNPKTQLIFPQFEKQKNDHGEILPREDLKKKKSLH